jgi:hypothetical protein
MPSRPNVPVNVLLGLEALKAAFGWSDLKLHDHLSFDVKVRHALVFNQLGEGKFELRPKEGQELSASSLQSPDNEQASYRQKQEKEYVGYVANITETCDPKNYEQLVLEIKQAVEIA